MDRKILLILVALGFCWGAFKLLQRGLQDEQDPLWTQLDLELVNDYQTLDQAIIPLDSLYLSFHQPETEIADSLAFNILATPFLPTMEFRKFRFYVDLLKEHNFLLISGVSGAGTTTLTNRLAHFLASRPENLMEIYCAPQFDLEYHKRYIGEQVGKTFQKGELLQFFELCESRPAEKFVLLIDNLDKINPETFFGPLLWNKLDDPSFDLRYNEIPVEIPENFYLLSVTHAGASSKIELNNEHFRRLGNRTYLAPDRTELIIYLRNQLAEKREALQNDNLSAEEKVVLQQQIAALENKNQLKKFVYTFEKINEYIRLNYSNNHRLGQWSGLRRFYLPEDMPRLFEGFIEHVNALKPDQVLRPRDLAHVNYALEHEGLMKGSNFIARKIKALEEKGFLTEFIVGFTFLLISGLFSFFLFRKRQRYIKSYTDQVYKLLEQFENNELSYEEISKTFTNLKTEVDQLIIRKKINYSEASFFYTFIENKVKKIELAKEVNRNFRALVDSYMEDDILTKKEYEKLKSFLAKIKKKISMEDYIKFSDEVEALYSPYGVK